jgi:hypothetical protein
MIGNTILSTMSALVGMAGSGSVGITSISGMPRSCAKRPILPIPPMGAYLGDLGGGGVARGCLWLCAVAQAIRPEVGKEGFTYSHSLGRRHLQALSR